MIFGGIYYTEMAASVKVGRPCCVADIDLRHDPDQELYNQFFDACRRLDYPDVRRLARALQVGTSTVRSWRAGQHFPTTRGTAVLVIGWVDRGKPVKMITQAEMAASIFSGG